MRRAVALAAAAILAGACSAPEPGPPPTTRLTAHERVTPADPAPSPAVPARSPSVRPPTPSPSSSPSPTVVVGAFDVDRAMEVVTALGGRIGPRPAGSDADAEARALVAGAFRDAGWAVREESVDLPQGGTTANVVASAPGSHLTDTHVVVGAHLDTVARAPGANDNATGVGVLVALAEELADERSSLSDPVVLVAFGAEEYQPSSPREHHIGSQAYAGVRARDVVEMVSVDMVGHGSPTCICWLRGTADDLARRLADVASREGLAHRVEVRGDISDHGPFALAGVPAAFLWTFDDGVLHTPADTLDRVRPEDVARAGELVLAWLRSR